LGAIVFFVPETPSPNWGLQFNDNLHWKFKAAQLFNLEGVEIERIQHTHASINLWLSQGASAHGSTFVEDLQYENDTKINHGHSLINLI